MASPIEFYFDFISPYGYLASTRIETLSARYARTVEWKPFLLGVTVLKIMGLKPLMNTPLKSDYVRRDKPRMARLLGVPFEQPNMRGVDSLRASRAFLWLKERDPQRAKPFAHRIFSRLWARREDITSAEAVAEEAGALGVDTPALIAAIESAEGKQRLKTAVDEAVSRGVFGSPYFIVDREPIWGVDRLWMLEHWLRHGNWEPPPAR
jgi:2-hydroxychromene-2-carboxylate isomerase